MTWAFTYDPLDNVLSEITGYSSGAYNGEVDYTYDAAGRKTGSTIWQGIPGWGTGTQIAYNYVYNSDNELIGLSDISKQMSLSYDLDGNRTVLGESLNGNYVETDYGYDADNRLTSQNFWTNSGALGNLTYGYDLDSRLITQGGSLAGINLPASVSPIQYSATNQIIKWGTIAATPDAASNLRSDPAAGASLTWDARNQLSSVSGGPAASFSLLYDGKGRRENDTGAYTGTNYYVDDLLNVGASANANGTTLNLNNYLAVPGSGEILSYTDTVGSQNTTYVPLHDYMGSTIGLVSPANTLQTQWTYTPSGVPTQTNNALAGIQAQSGTASSFPFLFGGQQYDPTGYYGDYSPTLMHSLSGGGGLPNGQAPGPVGLPNAIPQISFRTLGGGNGFLCRPGGSQQSGVGARLLPELFLRRRQLERRQLSAAAATAQVPPQDPSHRDRTGRHSPRHRPRPVPPGLPHRPD